MGCVPVPRPMTPPETEITAPEPTRERVGSVSDGLTGAAEEQDDQISGAHWIVGGLIGLVCIGPCLALGLHTTRDHEYDQSLWYKCWGPCVPSAPTRVQNLGQHPDPHRCPQVCSLVAGRDLGG